MKNIRMKLYLLSSTVIASLVLLALLTPHEVIQRWVTYIKGDTSAYDYHIMNVSQYYGFDPYLVKAVIKAESRFDREALSASGAMGLMQLMPSTAKDLGVKDPYDPRENIEAGVKYLKALLDRFDNDLSLALAAYNAGPETVKRYGTVPPFQETKDYLRRVLKYYSEYKEHT